MTVLQDFILSLKDQKLSIAFGNFLDDIRREFKDGKLNKNYFEIEPDWPEEITIEKRALYTAYFHKLSNEFRFKLYPWMFKEEYFLKDPYFSMNAKGDLRIVLLIESPKEFRMRNIYVGENVLRRV